jgi:branched-chain amino acid transport system ATP-binding protein
MSLTDQSPATIGRGNDAPILDLRGITAGFGHLTVLRDIDLSVRRGTAVGLLGPNGAGKTTLLRLAAGLMRPSSGSVWIAGEEVTHRHVEERAQRGLCLIPEGRGIFRNLTVAENLRLQLPPWRKRERYDEVLETFPILKERLRQTAGTLSGGQQQMLALARCYLAKPSVVLLDEVSMGLAPRLVDQIFDSLKALADSGVALLLVEQYVNRALEMVDEVYLVNRGRITHRGPAGELDENSVLRHYLGGDMSGAEEVASNPSTPVAGAPAAVNGHRPTA